MLLGLHPVVWLSMLGILCAQVACFLHLRHRFLANVSELVDGADEHMDYAGPISFHWLTWILERLQQANARRQIVTRQLALEEFEWELSHDQLYLFLQRIGIVCPIVGVVITAGSVIFDPYGLVGKGEGVTSATVLMAMKPLLGGVLAGALLAIFNQILLQFLGGPITRLRRQVRIWLDRREDIRGDLMDAATASEILKRSLDSVNRLHDTAEQHLQHSTNLQQSVRILTDSGVQFSKLVKLMAAEITTAQALLHDWRGITTDTGQFVRSVAATSSTSVERLQRTAQAVQQATEANLLPALHRQGEFVAAFTNFIMQSQSVAGDLGQLSRSLTSAIGDFDSTRQQFRTAWRDGIQPAQALLGEQVANLASSSEGLRAAMDTARNGFQSLNESVQQVGPLWEQQVATLSAGASSITEMVDKGLAPATVAQQKSCALWEESAEALSQTLGKWTEALRQSTHAAQGHEQCLVMWQTLVHERLEPAYHSLFSATAELHDGATLFRDGAASSCAKMNECLAGLAPVPASAANSLKDLHAAVDQFSQIISSTFRTAAEQHAGWSSKTHDAIAHFLEKHSQLTQGADRLGASLDHYASMLESAHQYQQHLTSNVEEVRNVTHQLSESVSQQIDPGSRHVYEAAKQLHATTNLLANLVTEKLLPAMESTPNFVAAAQQVQVTLHSLAPLAEMSPQLKALPAILKELTEVVAALKEIPTAVRESVNHQSRWWPFQSKPPKNHA
jgi:ABC-type transporter Mla subunit MlaD